MIIYLDCNIQRPMWDIEYISFTGDLIINKMLQLNNKNGEINF